MQFIHCKLVTQTNWAWASLTVGACVGGGGVCVVVSEDKKQEKELQIALCSRLFTPPTSHEADLGTGLRFPRFGQEFYMSIREILELPNRDWILYSLHTQRRNYINALIV